MKSVPTSYRVVNIVRAAISTPYVTASDTEVARALGISRAAVSAYKHGRDIMSAETLQRAQTVAKIETFDFIDLMFDLLIEGKPSDVSFLREAKEHMRRMAARAASVLLALVAAAGAHSPTRSESYSLSASDLQSSLYILLNRLRIWLRGSANVTAAPS